MSNLLDIKVNENYLESLIRRIVREEMKQPELPFDGEKEVLGLVKPARDVEEIKIDSSEVDSRGLPWDARIHGKKRIKNMDGTWRRIKGINPAKLLMIEEQLLNAMKKGKPKKEEEPKGEEQTPFGPPPTYPNTAPVEEKKEEPKAEVKTDLKIPSHVENAHSYTWSYFKSNLPIVLNDLITAKKIDLNYINALKEYFNVNEIWEMFSKEDKIKELYNNLAEVNIITKVEQ